MADSIHKPFVLNRYSCLIIFIANLFIYPARNLLELFLFSFLGIFLVQLALDFKGTIKYCKVFALTLPRDLKSGIRLVRYLKFDLHYLQKFKKSAPRLLEDAVKSHPYQTALIQAETGKRWNTIELHEYCNSVANYFLLKGGYNRQDSIGFICDNRLEFPGTWLGLARAGLVPALINTKLTGESLRHSITTVNCKAVIVLSEFLDAVLDLNLPKSIQIYELTVGDDLPSERSKNNLENVINLTEKLKTSSRLDPEQEILPESFDESLWKISNIVDANYFFVNIFRL